MKRVLLDTNIVLDGLPARKPHLRAGAAVWAAIEELGVEGMPAGHSVTTIHYLIRRDRGLRRPAKAPAAILRVFTVAAADGGVMRGALHAGFPGFEDAHVGRRAYARVAQVAGIARDDEAASGVACRSEAGRVIGPPGTPPSPSASPHSAPAD